MQETTSEAQIRELAERLLRAQWPFTAEAPPSLKLLPGRLPDDLPFTISLPPGSRLLGSAVRSPGMRSGAQVSAEETDIALEAPGDAASILAWFDQTLLDEQWRPPGARTPVLPGFQSAHLPTSRTYCRGERGPWLAMIVTPGTDGLSDVRLYVNTVSPGPCASQAEPLPGRPAIAALLPNLTSPTNVLLSPIGGGGAEDRWSSDAIARTTIGVVELEAEVARQLATAGWTRHEGRTDGPVAWSAWRVPAVDEHHGLLFVTEGPRPDLRWLHVHVLSARVHVRYGAPGGWIEGRG